MSNKDELRIKFLYKVNIELPKYSENNTNCPIVFNHSWARILYDNLFQEYCWNKLDSVKGPVYLQLNEQQLLILLTWCEELKQSPELIKLMNNNSLRWRNEARSEYTEY